MKIADVNVSHDGAMTIERERIKHVVRMNHERDGVKLQEIWAAEFDDGTMFVASGDLSEDTAQFAFEAAELTRRPQ